MSKDDGSAEEALPCTFGRYTLVERLATGGMAEVFKAKILSTHGFEKLLVIKRILPHLAADKNFVAMFIDEAKLTVQLTHPKVIQITDFGEVQGQYFIALEFIDGFDALALLRSSAQKSVRIPYALSMFITMEVLDALDYAHNALDGSGKPMRLVHRDISPSNIFISRRGDVKLADFGIAHAQERESKTQAGTLKGKYGYMSPEQVVGAKLDGRSDIFAIGIVLAEMLMGRRLFTAPTDLDVLLMVRDGRLERLDKYCRDLPPSLDRIVRKALKKRVADRYQTASEFRDDLADFLFRFGFRVGPSDIGELAKHYFDKAPDGTDRLKHYVKKWDVAPEKAKTTGPADEEEQRTRTRSTKPTPPPRTSDERPRKISQPTVVDGGEDDDDLDVVIDTDVGEQENTETILPPVPSAEAMTPSEAALHQAINRPISLVDIDQAGLPKTGGAAAYGGGGTPNGADLVHPHTPAGAVVPSSSDTGPLPYVTPPSYGALPSGADKDSSGAISIGGGAYGSPFAGQSGSRPGTDPSGIGPRPTTDLSQNLTTGARPPDKGGDLAIISPMRIFADLAISGETGLLRLEIAPHVKEVYLVRGAPESVNSSLVRERFGEYLVSRGFLTAKNLNNANQQLARYQNKLGDTLVGMGLMRPLDVFRLLSQQVRERVMEIFSWVQGYYSFYRGARNPTEAFPLGLDTFEILGAGLLTLPYEFLEQRFLPFLDYRPRVNPYGRIQPEAFRLGPTPREVLGFLDGSRTLREWMGRFNNPNELLTFLRTLYLLVETDLAQFG